MSCIRFNTPAQREAMRRMAPNKLSPGATAAIHSAPAFTESKLRRLRLLARHENPKIRESVASSYHTTAELLEALAADADAGVRACVARNEATPCDLLRRLARDESETVRGWVAVNYFAPEDAMGVLAEDTSATVRSLVAWKTSIAVETG